MEGGARSHPSHTRGPIGGMCAFLTGCVCIWRLRGEATESLGLDCPVSSVCCIGVSEGAYVYMAHLRAIDGKRPVGPAQYGRTSRDTNSGERVGETVGLPPR